MVIFSKERTIFGHDQVSASVRSLYAGYLNIAGVGIY